MKLVMVHGRSQQHKDPATLEKKWRDALTYGLARGDAELAPAVEFVFPYYGDTLDELVHALDAPPVAEAITRGGADEADERLRGEILQEIAAGLGIRDADIGRETEAPGIAKGPQNWGWVRATLRALDRIPGINAEAIDLFTRDVFVYLTYPAVRRQIDQIVSADVPSDGPFVLLAHSLGTVVAYNVLRTRHVDPRCVRLVTVGCPLGISAIQQRLTHPLDSPKCVENWFNAYDLRDVVALRPLDAASFNVTPAIDNKGDVTNFTDNRHGIEGYLADPVVAQKIAEALRG